MTGPPHQAARPRAGAERARVPGPHAGGEAGQVCRLALRSRAPLLPLSARSKSRPACLGRSRCVLVAPLCMRLRRARLQQQLLQGGTAARMQQQCRPAVLLACYGAVPGGHGCVQPLQAGRAACAVALDVCGIFWQSAVGGGCCSSPAMYMWAEHTTCSHAASLVLWRLRRLPGASPKDIVRYSR